MRRWIVCASVVPLGLMAYLFHARSEPDPIVQPTDDFARWAPAPDQLRAEVDSAGAGKSGVTAEQAKIETFQRLFQRRYRSHEPAIAVGIRIAEPKMVRLLVPARMEPWNLDKLTMTAWREASADLGRRFDVDIFETFIGTRPIKIGQLRASPDGRVAHITYNYPAQNRD